MESAVPLRVRVWFISRVDDGTTAGGRRGAALPDVLGTLGGGVDRPAGRVEHLPGTGVDLATHEEWDERVDGALEIVLPPDEVVLVATIRVSRRVGVVLEEVDLAAYPLFGQPLLRRLDETLEDAFPCLVVSDEIREGVTLRSCVLGVAPDIEVEALTVLEEHIR